MFNGLTNSLAISDCDDISAGLDTDFLLCYPFSQSWISLAKQEKASMSNTRPDSYDQFLADTIALKQRRPNTLRAYRYELAAAAHDNRFRPALNDLTLATLEQWIYSSF